MKECPKCRRVYTDGSLNFCRVDGTRLVNKGVCSDDAVTIRFPVGKPEKRSGRMKSGHG